MDNFSQFDIFPLTFMGHMVFVAIGVIFFAYRFIKYRKIYQLLLGLVILGTVAIRFTPVTQGAINKTYYYSVGVIELILLVTAIIFAIITSIQTSKQLKLEEAEKAQNQISENNEGVTE